MSAQPPEQANICIASGLLWANLAKIYQTSLSLNAESAVDFNLSTDNPAGTTPNLTSASSSRLVAKVLSPAVKLWLRSQVQQVSYLEVKIEGGDRQILTGNIPRVSLWASQAVYQGLHLSQIQLVGEGIRTNLGQVLRGQPLRLLEPIPVFGELLLLESDLNASLSTPLLSHALTELLQTLFPTSYLVNQQISWQKITLAAEHLLIAATVETDTNNPTPLVIQTGLQLASCHELQLTRPQIIKATAQLPEVELDSFLIDLGPEVAITTLTLSPGQLLCCGKINVIP